MELIANLSSVCTVIMFILYIVGRIIITSRSNTLWSEEIECIADTNETSKNNSFHKCIDHYNLHFGNVEDNPSTIYITAVSGIRRIEVYLVDPDTDKTKPKPIYQSLRYIRSGFCVSIHTPLPECYRLGFVRITTHNYQQWELDIQDNMNHGYVEASLRSVWTPKSLLYELLK